jgi:hypothetical protein
MILNLKTTLKGFDGENLKDGQDLLTTGLALSKIITLGKTEGKMKLYILGEKFFKDATIDLDAADLNLVKEELKTTQVYINAIVTGQLEQILSELK